MSKNSDEYLSISTPSDLAKFKNMAEKDDGVKLNNLFGGRRRSRKASKKGSKKGSRKLKRSQRRASRKSRRSSRKASRKSRRSQRRASRKSRRASRKASRKSRRSQRRASRKSRRVSRRKSRRSRRSQRRAEGESDEGKKKRVMPEAAKKASEAFRNLANHIKDKMGIKFGPVLLKLAGLYNAEIKTKHPGIDAIETARKAKELFDKSSGDERKHMLAEAERLIAEKRAKK